MRNKFSCRLTLSLGLNHSSSMRNKFSCRLRFTRNFFQVKSNLSLSKNTSRYFTLSTKEIFNFFNWICPQALLRLLEKQVAWFSPTVFFMFQRLHHDWIAVGPRCIFLILLRRAESRIIAIIDTRIPGTVGTSFVYVFEIREESWGSVLPILQTQMQTKEM